MLTVNELFSGIGSQSAALKRLGVDYNVVHTCEIDKDAMLSYAAIHCDYINISKTYEYPDAKEMADYLQVRNIGFDFKSNKPYVWQRLIDKITGQAKKDLKKYYLACVLSNNIGDISKVEKLDYADFWTYSFPCQSVSLAGKQEGIIKGVTRSGLLYEVERLLEKSQELNELPKYLMLENVKNLVGKQFKPQFIDWLERLDQLGYNTYLQVLNAKNYGIPQNRERVFAISIRKDIDTGYTFPEPFDNGKRLKDILESEVDEKFYISAKKVNIIINSSFNQERLRIQRTDICDTLLERDYKDPNCVKIGIDKSINNTKQIEYANCITAREDRGISNHQSERTAVLETNKPIQVADLNHYGNDQMNRIYGVDGISPTITVVSGGGREQKVLIPQATKQGFIECNIPGVCDLTYPNSKTRRGIVQDDGNICPTLTASTQDICAIELPCIAASSSRAPNNPSDRTVGALTEQRLEINKNNTSNTITSVQKDNYALEQEIIKAFDIPKDIINDNERQRRGYETSGISPTVLARTDSSKIINDFKIRKLVPLECFRLMGFSDEDFYKAESVCSNSQLYRQAGNSIVVDVLYYLFKNLFTEEEKDAKILPGQMDIFDYIKN